MNPRTYAILSFFFLSCLVCSAQPTSAPAATRGDQIIAAQKLLTNGNAKGAIQILDSVASAYEQDYRDEKRRIYCSRTPTETLAYMVEAAAANIEAVAVSAEWSTAYYLKAYALIDLKRTSESLKYLELALKFSPNNPTFLSEKAHLLQAEKKWKQALELYRRAETCADTYSPENLKISEFTRALRGEGYCLVELGDLDVAEVAYQKCLKADPNDRRAAAELKYIADQKKQSGKPSN